MFYILSKKYFLLFALITGAAFAQGPKPVSNLYQMAKEIHDEVITIDTHCDINIKNFTDTKNYTQDLSSQVNLPKMEKGGLDVAWFIVYTGQGDLDEKGYQAAYQNAISKFDAIHNLTEKYAPERIEIAYTSADVFRIIKSGKKVAMIGIENAYPLGTDLKNIKKFQKLGGRYMSLAHQGHSQFSDSNTGEKDNIWLYNNGLSELGKKAVVEMNKAGVMVDVSHPSKGAFNDIIARSKAPIIASHSSARALCNHSRNLDDEQLLAIKSNGGVVQTVAFSSYVNTAKDTAYKNGQKNALDKVATMNQFEILDWESKQLLSEDELIAYNNKFEEIKRLAAKELTKAAKEFPPVNVSDFVDHIDYMVKLIGIDHVGISSDFDGGGGIEGWSDASETFNVTLELVKRGYTKEQIAKLWGLNLLRVLDEVQKIAAN
ncbi:dipeptidase [Namhaeicola litoreus]|uniref:Dipeptidase n=1 Tax=Namhaeicola litoreus TaxID=1052145 RepID=A0ABW3Y4H0_9FLAO